MRIYALDSPQAAARIVAMTLVSDGQLKRVELEVLEGLRADDLLYIGRGGLRAVVHDFCADLLSDAAVRGEAHCHIEPRLIERLFGEVREPALRRVVMQLCTAVVHADRLLHDGESIVLLAAMDHWGLRPEALVSREIATATPSTH